MVDAIEGDSELCALWDEVDGSPWRAGIADLRRRLCAQIGSGDRTLRALGAATGRPVWTYRLAAPALDITTGAGAVYALDGHGAVYGIRI